MACISGLSMAMRTRVAGLSILCSVTQFSGHEAVGALAVVWRYNLISHLFIYVYLHDTYMHYTYIYIYIVL